MTEPRLPPLALDGWYVLHQGFRLRWSELRDLDSGKRREIVRSFASWLSGREKPGEGGWSGAYRIPAGGIDMLLLHFRPALEELAEAEREVASTPLHRFLERELEYLSVVELGLYRATAEVLAELSEEGIDPLAPEGRARLEDAAEGQREASYVRDRLHPVQPEEMPYVCFYPMDKRREPGANWYTLPLEERNRLMAEHGRVGRRYAGRISQVISGSVGLDDWEWGVTLFGVSPLVFKELITEMRYDEASAEYAEFGPFVAGYRVPAPEWEAEIADL